MKAKNILLTLLLISTTAFSYGQSTNNIEVNKEYLFALNDGDFVKACGFMDPDLVAKKKLTPEKFEKVWTKFSSKYGKLVDIDSTETDSKRKITNIRTYAKLDKGTALLVTTFDKDGQIIGIHAYNAKRYKVAKS